MLYGKEGHQEQIDEERLDQRNGRSGVDVLGHHEADDKADSVEEGDKKEDVGCNSV